MEQCDIVIGILDPNVMFKGPGPMVIDQMTFIGAYLSFWKQYICQRGPYLFRFKSTFQQKKNLLIGAVLVP